MRLLNTRTWEMTEFISDEDIPAYIILSHTWGEGEVSLQQWEQHSADIIQSKGYQKIRQFGERAALDGWDWVWVDTCCIDKKSSAELTEAINSMFQWYTKAVECYVYLSDVTSLDKEHMTQQLRESRWFTRGWTLQELIAPRFVEFFNKDWRSIGSKKQLCDLLSSITGIDEHILKGGSLSDISIARKMSWASHRKTSRTEDVAYCLLGIFDVNLPLIYGEGRKAFRRLQEAIMSTTPDQSLFAWGHFVDNVSNAITEDQSLGRQPIAWKAPEERETLLGLFAESPADFEYSGEISPVTHGYVHHLNRRGAPSIVNGGVLLNLVIVKELAAIAYWDQVRVAQPYKLQLAVLLCRDGDTGSKLIGLPLHPWGDGYYSRTRELIHVNMFVSHFRFENKTRLRHVMPYRPFKLRDGDILLRLWSVCFESAGYERPITDSGPVWRMMWNDSVLRQEADAEGDEEIVFFYKMGPQDGIAITLRRLTKAKSPYGPLMIGASSVRMVHKKFYGLELSGVYSWVPSL
ncbi:hypothetical protein DL765_011053 [Monosporascus sp. GIB2]|nr:hypothetical protein DL765_011053 [Monosporascus sp. GIB2]